MTLNRMLLAEQLERDEGLRLLPYLDTVGKLTIGVGRNLTDRGITYGEAMHLLYGDLAQALDDLASFPWWDDLTDVRQRAVGNLRFNVGPSRFRGFRRMIDALEHGDWTRAAAEMLDSTWATQVGARADRLAGMMRAGIDDPASTPPPHTTG